MMQAPINDHAAGLNRLDSMRRLLPVRCAKPEICETHWHWGQGRWHCEYYRYQIVMDELPQAPLLAGRAKAIPFEHVAREAKPPTALAVHVPVMPEHAADQVVVLNGERQLALLTKQEIEAIDCLASNGIYGANERLRRGHSLDVQCGAYVDGLGYRSLRAFIDHALATFDHLGQAVALDKSITVFRGVGVPKDPDEFDPDIAGISRYFSSGEPWDRSFTDAGFGFAATDAATALDHDGTANGGYADSMTHVLFELDIHSALCIPAQVHRSADLYERTYGRPMLDTLNGQVVFPPGTSWEITSLKRNSEHGVPLVHMRQL
jgi:hypothetical protein